MIKRALALVDAKQCSVLPHITASVFINDGADLLGQLQDRTGEDNADAHLKRQVMGREVIVAVTNGCLDGSTELTPRARRSLWHVGADLSRPSGMAGPGALTGGDGSGCWSKSSGKCDPFARNYANRHRGWAAGTSSPWSHSHRMH